MCRYSYRLQPLTWLGWLGPIILSIGLALTIFISALAAASVVADPVINLYIDPVGTVLTRGGPTGSLFYADEPATWRDRVAKCVACLGLVGATYCFLTFKLPGVYKVGGLVGVTYSSHGSVRGATGGARLKYLNWFPIITGVVGAMLVAWKCGSLLSKKVLQQQANEQVLDVSDDSSDDGGGNDLIPADVETS